MIKLYPNYTAPESSQASGQRERPVEVGDEIMESARQLLGDTSMRTDDAAAVVHRSAGTISPFAN